LISLLKFLNSKNLFLNFLMYCASLKAVAPSDC
jgi:hypothetical protein